MHSIWEDRIFDYYNNLFVFDNIQTNQLFIATHSEHFLTNVLNREDSLVLKIKDNEYQTFYKGCSGEVLPTITMAEIKYLVFDMYTIDFHYYYMVI